MYYQNILDKMVESCKEIFREELTGIYLHGSLAMGCFNPNKSDIDLIIVIENDITDKQKTEFMKEVIELNKSAPAKGIELSVVKREYCKKFIYPTPFELHFSNMHVQWFQDYPSDYISKMKGTDKDLAAHFMIIRNYGIVLYGTGIDEIFGDVSKEDYVDSIWSDIEGAEEDILENPVYVILNLCRVAAFLKDGLVVSKKQGGEWGIKNLAVRYQDLLTDALECYASGEEWKPGEKDARTFAVYMLGSIKDMVEKQ